MVQASLRICADSPIHRCSGKQNMDVDEGLYQSLDLNFCWTYHSGHLYDAFVHTRMRQVPKSHVGPNYAKYWAPRSA